MVTISKRIVLIFIILICVYALLLSIPESYEQSIDGPRVFDESLKVQKLFDSFDMSSGFEFIDNDILVIQKDDGKIKRIKNFNLNKIPVLDLNVYNNYYDSGLTGITSTKVNDTIYVFVFMSENAKEDGGKQFNFGLGNRVYRYEWDGVQLTNQKLILDLPSAPYTIHVGGKMVIGNDNKLYTVIGDMDRNGKFQNNPSNDPSEFWLYDNKIGTSGILRTDLEGKPSKDNPFSEKDFEKFFAYGIRTSYGLAIDPITGDLWDVERGPDQFDEINLVLPGFNSGWKQIQGRSDQDCCFQGFDEQSNFVLPQNKTNLYLIENAHYAEPIFVFEKSSFISDLVFVDTQKLGTEFVNDLLVSDMMGNIYHFELNEKRDDFVKVTNIEDSIFASGLGTISDMKIGPDGALYVLTYDTKNDGFPLNKNDGNLYRIALNGNIIILPKTINLIDNWTMVSIFGILLLIIFTIKIKEPFVNKLKNLGRS